MVESRTRLLQWIDGETGLVYVADRTLIGHRDISSKVRAFRPGPHVDFVAVATAANPAPAPPTFTRRYRVTASCATIHQAW